ncbi:MAG: hypothetical protein D3903_17985 [Candidatus Electrothrix sp. GM3_4]|nr:hypothetical protein [Candidatus Electrothrix sp. GM3_4]
MPFECLFYRHNNCCFHNFYLEEIFMYIFTLRIVALLTVFITVVFSPHVQAAENMSELVNKSGMQRALSQRIAKAYFYLGNDVSTKETRLQMEMSIERFKKNLAVLKAKVQDSETKEGC